MSLIINCFGVFLQEKRTIFIESCLLFLNIINSFIYSLEFLFLKWNLLPYSSKLFFIFCYFCLFIELILNISLLIIHINNLSIIEENNKFLFSLSLIITIFSIISVLIGSINFILLLKDLLLFIETFQQNILLIFLLLINVLFWIIIVVLWIVESIRIFYKINDTYSNYIKLMSINSTFNKIDFNEEENELKVMNNMKINKEEKKKVLNKNKIINKGNINNIGDLENAPINNNN